MSSGETHSAFIEACANVGLVVNLEGLPLKRFDSGGVRIHRHCVMTAESL